MRMQAVYISGMVGMLASGLNLKPINQHVDTRSDVRKVNELEVNASEWSKIAGHGGLPAIAAAYNTDAGLSGSDMWRTSVAVDNKVVGLPYFANKILTYATDTDTVAYNTDAGLSGSYMWLTSVAVDNKVVGLPARANKIVIYATDTDTVTYNTDAGLSGVWMWFTSTAVDNKVVGLPYDANKIVIYATDTDAVTYNTDAGLSGSSMWGNSVAVDNKVVGLPASANKIVIYATDTDTVTYNTDAGLSGSTMWVNSIAIDNKVVGLPYNADKIVIYATDTDTVTYNTDAGLSGSSMWGNSVAVGNTVVGLPYDANKIVIYATDTDTVTYNTDAGLSGSRMWVKSVAVDNKVVGLPYNADKIVTYATDTDTVAYNTDAGLSGSYMWFTSVAVDNKVVGLPYSGANKILAAQLTPTPSPTESPTPAPTTCQDAGTCSIYEDPHIKVFDGMQISLLGGGRLALADYHGADFWLVRSSDISIQARYKPDPDMPEHNMFVQAVAVGGPMLNGSTLILGSLDEQISWNGETILESQTSEFHADLSTGTLRAQRHLNSHLVEDMTHSNAGVDIDLPQGVKLTVNRLQHHVNLFIEMHPATGGQDGLCGNFNCNAYDDALGMILRNRDPKVRPGDSLFKA